jgi:hypothetical protein
VWELTIIIITTTGKDYKNIGDLPMSKTIRIVKNGEKRKVHPEDLPWVILQLENGMDKGLIESIQHTPNIRAYRKKDYVFGSTIFSWDQENEGQLYFDYYQFKVFCEDLDLKIRYSEERSM